MSPLALSFTAAALATVISGTVGILLAWLMTRRRFVGRDLLDVLLTAPLILPPTVLGYYLLVVLGRRSGLGHAWEALFGSPLVFSRSAVVLAACIGALPLIVRSTRTALEGVDPMLPAVARTLGAGRWRTFLTVELPLAAPGIVSGLMLGFARGLGDFGVTLMLAGNLEDQTRTASLAIYDAVAAGHDSQAAGLAAMLTGLGLGVLYLAIKLSRRGLAT